MLPPGQGSWYPRSRRSHLRSRMIVDRLRGLRSQPAVDKDSEIHIQDTARLCRAPANEMPVHAVHFRTADTPGIQDPPTRLRLSFPKSFVSVHLDVHGVQRGTGSQTKHAVSVCRLAALSASLQGHTGASFSHLRAALE